MVKTKMLLETLSHIMAFDFVWVAALILNNLHWVFALFAFAFIEEKGHRPVWHFLLTVGLLYAFSDIMGLAGWILIPAIVYVTFQLAFLIYFPEGSWPRKNFTKIIVVFLFVTAFINTLYFRFPG